MATEQNTRRKMVVYIRREFYIEERGNEAPKKKLIKRTGIDAQRGGEFIWFSLTEDGRIAQLFDQAVAKDSLKRYAEEKMFLEVCDFEFFNGYNETIVDAWSGNFLDVFRWLDKNLFEIQREAGDCA